MLCNHALCHACALFVLLCMMLTYFAQCSLDLILSCDIQCLIHVFVMHDVAFEVFSLTQSSGNPLDVTLFHFLSWPREGSPPIDSILKMMGEVEYKQRDSKGPLMVMCE